MAGVKHIFKFLSVLALSLAVLEKAPAGSLTLSWDASTSADVTGYDVYYGTNSGNYPYMINVGNATTVTISNLSAGVTYYIAATAYDADGDQSAYSGQISYLVPGLLTLTQSATPGGPALIQFSVNGDCRSERFQNLGLERLGRRPGRHGANAGF